MQENISTILNGLKFLSQTLDDDYSILKVSSLSNFTRCYRNVNLQFARCHCEVVNNKSLHYTEKNGRHSAHHNSLPDMHSCLPVTACKVGNMMMGRLNYMLDAHCIMVIHKTTP